MDAHTATRPRNRNEYTVGWVCALPKEQTAATAMLDQTHPDLPNPRNDHNAYTLGSIGMHNIVVACLPQGKYGTNAAATVAACMASAFPSIKLGLMIGIGGGIPPDVRLGDVVVSSPGNGYPGVVQWDLGKAEHGGKLKQTGALNNPPMALLSAVSKLRTAHEMKGSRIPEYLDDLKRNYPKLAPKYTRSALLRDPLSSSHDSCRSRGTWRGMFSVLWDAILAILWYSLGWCSSTPADSRTERAAAPSTAVDSTRGEPDDVCVHYGLVASGNRVIKDAKLRDSINDNFGGHVLCVEMEAAGLMDNFPCLVIRGICDYADSHKSKDWQEYAAAVAAAYAKEILSVVPAHDIGQMSSIKRLDKKVDNLSNSIQDLRSRRLNQEHQAILDWLTPVDYGTQQSDYFGRRQPGTGQWFLDSAEYLGWLKTNGKTLFCPGIPGAGKTILSSIVINDLDTRFSDNPNIGIGYIYCNFRQEQEQKLGDLLATLLKQLARAQPCLPESVNSLHDKHKKKGTRPLLEELSVTLRSVVELYAKVFIIIDALDECQAPDGCRGNLLSEIFNLQDRFRVNLCVTSRPLSDIISRFDRALCLDICATKHDVGLYLESHVGTLWSVVKTNRQLQIKIKTGISDAVDGMLLLAHIYLQSLKDKVTENDIRSALERIQKQKRASGGDEGKLLSAAYDQAMERINGQELGLRTLARRALSWITCAKRQLTAKELQHALATKEGKRSLDTGDLVHLEDVVSVCAGLVTVDKESDIIRLTHYTTQQYFNDRRDELFPNVESDITTTCVTYMSFDVFESGFCRTDEELEERLQSSPLYDYAAQNWGHHARPTPTPCQELIKFLDSNAKVESSSQALMAGKYSWGRHSQDVPGQMTGLHLVAYFGIENSAQILIGRDDQDSMDSYGRSPLSYAAEQGHAVVVKQLLDTGKVEVDARDTKYGRTPLSWAAREGNVTVFELLLNTGKVDIDTKDLSGRTPLWWAAEQGHEAIVNLLTKSNLEGERKTDIDEVYPGPRLTPLGIAVWRGHVETIKVLLKNGANPKGIQDARPPLWVAAAKTRNRAVHIVRILLQYGADLNQRSALDEDTTPLITAVHRHSVPEVISFLVDSGANPQERINGKSAQEEAEMRGDSMILHALLPYSERTRKRIDAVELIVSLLLGIIFLVNKNLVVNDSVVAGEAGICVAKDAIKRRFNMTGVFEKRFSKEIQEQKDPEKLKKDMVDFIKANRLNCFFPPDNPFLEKVVKNTVRLSRDLQNTASTRDLTRLALYQPVLYCDDSRSMRYGGRIGPQTRLVQRIANITTKIVPDNEGIELRFINADTTSDMTRPNLQQIDSIMNSLSFEGSTAIGTNLKTKVLESVVYRPLRENRLKRPVLISIITDGEPNQEHPDTLKSVILECGRKLRQHQFDPKSDQIGADAEAEDFLNRLDDDPELNDVLYRTTERLGERFEGLRNNESELEAWLLTLLMGPILDAGEHY